jgi:lysophospholipase L1-like esterase
MIRRLVVTALFLVVVTPRLALALPQPPYYLALGDSLSQGVQPRFNGTLSPTTQGYVDDVFGVLRLTHPFLQLKKLGCSGETIASMLLGGNQNCAYAGSQLDQAVAFIQTHRVALITITIGGDDILQCISKTGVIDDQCLKDGKDAIEKGLPSILTALRLAAGPYVPIIGANYYDPFLAAWVLLPPPAGPMLAQESLLITTQGLNPLLEGIYTGFGIKVADVASAYRITDFTLIPGINLPRNVFLELVWTWIGAPPPRGPDIHPNANGYAVIAAAFIKKIRAF